MLFRRNRARSSMISAPLGLPTSATRSSGFVAWTETCIGLTRCSSIRSQSRSDRFVSVTKLP